MDGNVQSGEAAASAATSAPGPSTTWQRALKRALIFVFAYYLILVYPVLRLAWLLAPDWQPGTAALLFILVGPVTGRLAVQAYPGRLTRWYSAAAYTWLGLCFMALALLVVFEPIAWLVDVPDRAFGQALLALLGACFVVGTLNAHRLRVRTVEIEASGAAAGVEIVQLSDVHLGSRGVGLIRRAVARTNALAPDYVFITGDLVDAGNLPRAELEPLAALSAPTYFVIGNHERYVDCDAICEKLRSLGVIVLRDASATAGPLQIIGIDDADERRTVERRLAGIPVDDSRFPVLLYHRPDGLEAAAERGIRLMLCGHTHNGQIVPFNFLAKRSFPRVHGLYRHGAAVLYVSPGTGTWGPVLRLGSQNEITRVVLREPAP